MLSAVDILKMLAKLDKDLETAMTRVKTDPDKPTCNNGYVIGLQMARNGIHQIFMEVDADNQRAKRAFDALMRGIPEEFI